MKKQLLLFLCLAHLPVAFTQSLTATANKTDILIGDTFQLQLKGTFPKGGQSWPLLDTMEHFEILNRSGIDTQNNFLGTTLIQNFTLTSWDSGKWQLPPFTAGKAHSAPVTITVSFSTPFDPAQPYHDTKDIVAVNKPEEANWYWYVLFGLVLVLLFVLFFPKEKKKAAVGFVVDGSAYGKAIRALDELAQRQPPADELHTRMIGIFREYLHRRRNIWSFSKTTDDLAVQLSALDLPRPAYQKLLQALRLSDLVKFARFSPAPEENKEALETIRESIVHIEQLKDAV